MAVKSGSKKKSGITRRIRNSGEKDGLIIELKERNIVLEKELQNIREKVHAQLNELQQSNNRLVAQIEERKNVEEQLAWQAELLSMVYDGVWAADTDFRFTYWNKGAERMLGWTAEEALGKNANDLLKTRFVGSTREESIKKLLQNGHITDEVFYLHKEGRYVAVEVNFSVMKGPDGKMRGLIVTGRDITERKMIENALRGSEEKYRAFFENSIDAILITSPDGSVDAVNIEACKMFGMAEEEFKMAGRNGTMDLSDPRLRLALEERAKTGKFRGELNCVKKDGTIFPCDISTSYFTDKNGRVKTTGIIRDITERKHAEEELRNTSDYLESLINYANAPIIVWDPAHKITRFNHAFEHLTGYAADEVIGKRLDLLFPEESREESLCKIQRTLTEHWESVEIPILGRDGWVRIALWNSANIYDKDGKTLLATIAQGQDITERKQIEKKLNAAKMQAELYLDLMGHDINNMHQIALGYLELARDMQADGGGSEYLVRPIEVLQRSALLIQNVRKLQKLKEGVFQNQEVDVSKVLSDVHLEYDMVTQKTVTLNLNGYEHCYVKANELLHDVFANLVSNAIKHTGDQADIVIDMDVVKDNGSGYCRVMIEDNGLGIPDDLKDQVFNRMRRGTTNVQGMGLGLYLVKSLVESYYGQVWVEDRVHGDHTKGARFVVLLPAVEP